MSNFKYVGSNSHRGLAIFRGHSAHRSYCDKHHASVYAKLANARRSWGIPPRKIDTLRLSWGHLRVNLVTHMIVGIGMGGWRSYSPSPNVLLYIKELTVIKN